MSRFSLIELAGGLVYDVLVSLWIAPLVILGRSTLASW
jgi:hypothetical protein